MCGCCVGRHVQSAMRVCVAPDGRTRHRAEAAEWAPGGQCWTLVCIHTHQGGRARTPMRGGNARGADASPSRWRGQGRGREGKTQAEQDGAGQRTRPRTRHRHARTRTHAHTHACTQTRRTQRPCTTCTHPLLPLARASLRRHAHTHSHHTARTLVCRQPCHSLRCPR